MKFFKNLPKSSFASLAGNFIISDFFTYLDVNRNEIDISTVNIDNKTTLIEAAHAVYNDVNSFWAFVAANQTTNPFDVLAPNSTVYAQQNKDKINLILLPNLGDNDGGVAFPVGSILTPYVGNTGASYQYGSTGDFDVNGPFAIVEASSFYDDNMIIGSQYGGTFITLTGTGPHITVIQKNVDGSYTWAGSYYAANKKSAANRVYEIVKPTQALTIYRETVAGNSTIDSGLPQAIPVPDSPEAAQPEVTVQTVNYDTQQTVNNIPKQIQAYVPSQLGFVQSSFVTTKYS
jgi:hypothetical protein